VLTIPSPLEATVRDVSNQRKISVDSLVNSALSDYLGSLTRRIYQISTSTALVEGVYSGSRSSSTLLQHGDFGLGTFEGLDGEMMILDGKIYQGAGTARRRTDDFLVLFAAITHFHEKNSFEIKNVAQLKDIELACDHFQLRGTWNCVRYSNRTSSGGLL
jgi:acetolactate decarboxylase